MADMAHNDAACFPLRDRYAAQYVRDGGYLAVVGCEEFWNDYVDFYDLQTDRLEWFEAPEHGTVAGADDPANRERVYKMVVSEYYGGFGRRACSLHRDGVGCEAHHG